MIWFSTYKLEDIQAFSNVNMHQYLGIEITEIGDDFLSARMPVDERTKQPFGLLHGGASVVLSETLGSCASGLVVNPTEFRCVGLEINANHLKSVSEGYVYGCAKSVHLGKSTHVWSIEIKDERNRLVCISRITMAIIPNKIL